MGIKFSIIIPVYNTEKYIYECLTSILNQTYKEFEVIIVDDGSKDNSYNICNEFSKMDKRIHLYKQKNAGVSSARNFGIEKSKGDYIIFVDSDDYCEKDYLMTISNYLKPKGLIGFGFKKKYLNKEKLCVSDSFYVNKKDEMEEAILLNSNLGGYICNKVFSSNIIKKYNIRFNTNIHYCEDLKFTIDYIKHCNGIRYLNYIPYVYRMRKSSVSFNYINKNNSTILDLLNILIDDFDYNDKIQNNLKFQYLINYYKFKKIYDKANVRNDVINKEREIINKCNFSLKKKIKYYLIYKNRFIYYICKVIKSKLEKVYS